MQNIPVFAQSPPDRQRARLPGYESPIAILSNYLAVPEHNFSAQQRHSRPIQELDPFVWGVVAPVVQVLIVIQPPRREAVFTVPNHNIRIRSNLYGAFLRVKPIQFGGILRSQFDEPFHIYASSLQHPLGEEQWYSRFHSRKTVRNSCEPFSRSAINLFNI
jgi:hypothetical protein